MPKLITRSYGDGWPELVMTHPVSDHLLPIYNLLRNGVNVSVTLEKEDGLVCEYRLDNLD